MTLPPRHTLSKSTYMMGCQCPKRLWLYKKRPDLIPELSAGQEMVFQKGTDVGQLAKSLFPGGNDATPVDHFHYPEAIKQTKDWLNEGAEIVYEAAFQHNGVMTALDILLKKKGRWYAYEVKSSTEVKDYQLRDAALQYHVITGTGLQLADIAIIYLNKEYWRKGDLDLGKLFLIQSVKKEVLALQKEIPEKVEELKLLLRQKKEPAIDIGPHCSDPFACEFSGYCWSHLPEPSVFQLANMRWNKRFELYYQGITEFHQLPDCYSLSVAQQLQVRAHLEGYTHIEAGNISKWLRQLKYPLYFMDFETFMPAVPLYDNSKPYGHIPFQFSVHMQQKPDDEAGHLEYLGYPEADPRPDFVNQLVSALGKKGSVLVYNKAFECTRLNELKELYPQQRKDIDSIIARIVDLMEPFQKKWYYTAAMNGSHSIKEVLPALVPELSYDDMEIGEGGTAMAAFEGMLKMDDEDEKQRIRKALLEYCGLDTIAMVKILEKLKSVI